jgi:hypothetical protein
MIARLHALWLRHCIKQTAAMMEDEHRYHVQYPIRVRHHDDKLAGLKRELAEIENPITHRLSSPALAGHRRHP